MSARVTSPGSSRGPPPTIAAYELVWCGVRNGGVRTRSRIGPSPDTEATIVADSESSSESGGRSVGIVRASIVLPVPGGPIEQQAVAARERDLERPPRLGLAAHLGEVGRRQRRRERRPGPRRRHGHGGRRELHPRRRASGAARRRERSASTASTSRAAGTTSRPSTRRASSAPSAGTITRRTPAPGERRDHRQQPGHGPDLAAERDLADERGPPGARRELLRPDQDADRDREVRRGPGLGHVRRREVDRDPARRMHEARSCAARRGPARAPRGSTRRPARRS